MRLIGLIALAFLITTPCWADEPLQPKPNEKKQAAPLRARDIIISHRLDRFDFLLDRFAFEEQGVNIRLKEFKGGKGETAKRLEIRGSGLGRGSSPGVSLVFRF